MSNNFPVFFNSHGVSVGCESSWLCHTHKSFASCSCSYFLVDVVSTFSMPSGTVWLPRRSQPFQAILFNFKGFNIHGWPFPQNFNPLKILPVKYFTLKNFHIYGTTTCITTTYTIIREIFMSIFFLFNIFMLKYFVGHGNPQKLNTQNVCCTKIFVRLVSTVCLPH